MTSSGIADAGLVALVAIVPLVVLMLTSFVKISVVLSLVRNAIGSTDAPSGLVVMGLSLVLTFFVMAPIAVQIVTAAAGPPSMQAPAPPAPAPPGPAPGTPPADVAPPTTSPPAATTLPWSADVDAALRRLVPADRQDALNTIARALVPLRAFLAKHADARDKATFVDLSAKLGRPSTDEDLSVLAPAFVTSELREAFAIAVLIFIPFLVIDLLVGLGLAALGLQTTSPQVVALPFKLLLFVAVDGWRLLIDSLLRGYA